VTDFAAQEQPRSLELGGAIIPSQPGRESRASAPLRARSAPCPAV
jgi:hypothetical protein